MAPCGHEELWQEQGPGQPRDRPRFPAVPRGHQRASCLGEVLGGAGDVGGTLERVILLAKLVGLGERAGTILL